MTTSTLNYQLASRERSWLTIEQIETEHWSVMHKICDVLFTNEYSDATKNFARSILDFTIDHGFMTWKQYDAMMRTKTIKQIENVNLTGKRVQIIHSSRKRKK
jgi:hypothetical protein